MDLDRLSGGEDRRRSAVLLFIFMFFDWFKVEVTGGDGFSVSEGGNAWNAFGTDRRHPDDRVLVAVGVAVVRSPTRSSSRRSRSTRSSRSSAGSRSC